MDVLAPQRTAQIEWAGLFHGTVSLVLDHAPYRFDEPASLPPGRTRTSTDCQRPAGAGNRLNAMVTKGAAGRWPLPR